MDDDDPASAGTSNPSDANLELFAHTTAKAEQLGHKVEDVNITSEPEEVQ